MRPGPARWHAGRFWARTKSLLDNAKEGPFGMAQRLIATADRTELGTLLQELPAYLQTRGHTTEWIDTAVGQVAPEYARATKQLKTSKQALIIAEHNAQSLRRSFAEGRSMSILADARQYDPDA
jgi:hypothetical protein